MDIVRRLVVTMLLMAGVVLPSAHAAWAQTYTGVTPPNVGGNVVGRGPENAGTSPQPEVLGLRLSSPNLTSGSPSTPSGGTAEVLGFRVSAPGAPQVASARVGGLAFTGADVASLVLVALAFIFAGVVVKTAARARPTVGAGEELTR